jgi:ATP-dependent helicase HrpB
MTAPLPIHEILPALCAALRHAPCAVLEAPPGAGKTTQVPLALMDEPWATGRLIMLEPRRLAARAAARRMAGLLGETAGQRIGFRTRGETRISAQTRIEVVTEGVLTRMIQRDPALEGVSAVIFDEVHERNLNADLGLALIRDIQGALRPDLRLLAMSATLDAAPFAALMGGAPILRSESVAHSVETRFAERALPDRRPATLATAVAEAVDHVLATTTGDVLAFLPGAGEINRCAALLRDRLDRAVAILRLYADAPRDEQQAALTPARTRRIVLASAIAETSLTVPGVRVVIDAGVARRNRFDPASGMSRLVTERASRAEADQRRGRAGREGPGLCIRLWTRGEHGALPAFAPPEIATADLAPLALDLAAWGAPPEALAFLTPPPEGHFAQARALLGSLGLISAQGLITPLGRQVAELPMHPRLAVMVATAGDDAPTARLLAALLSEGDPCRGGPADLTGRLDWIDRPGSAPPDPALRERCARIRETAARLGAIAPVNRAATGRLLARAFPDRVAQRRPGGTPRFLLAGGKGAWLDATDGLASSAYLVAADLDGDRREARIRLAAPLDAAIVQAGLAGQLETVADIAWDARNRSVMAHEDMRLGALVVARQKLAAPDPDGVAHAMLTGIRSLGLETLPWSPSALSLLQRVRWLRTNRGRTDLPDWREDALLGDLEHWLPPYLAGIRRASDLAQLDLTAILRNVLGPSAPAVDGAAPPHLATPVGRVVPIDYELVQPVMAVRPQWLYGLDEHPTVSGDPVVLKLLSPADRPIATTADLPGFWRGMWKEVRKELRGRYPKHQWPEEPWLAAATTRAKPHR